jgi:hypothetical protein
MEYNKLVAVTGLSGLFELISSKSDGGIVRSLEDKSSKFVSNRLHQFSHLESIEVFTNDENVNLTVVFLAMKTNSSSLPDANNAKDVKSYFEKVYPSMDFERVYSSDMKKMIKWFDILSKNNIEIKLSESKGEEAVNEVPSEKKSTASVKAATPKAAAVKNAPAKKINTPRKMA